MVWSMWVELLLTLCSASSSPVTFADAVALADEAPAAVAAAAAARDHDAAADRLAPMDGLRVELQPGAQFQPFDRVTSPAGQLVIEGTTGAASLFGSRRDLVRRDAAVLDGEARAFRLERRLQVSEAWHDRRRAELDEAAARAAWEAARELLARFERLRQAEAVALVVGADDVHAVRALEAEAALAVLDAEAARLEAGLRLARLLGREGEVATVGPLPDTAAAISPPASSSSSGPSAGAAGADGSEGPHVEVAAAAVAAARAGLLAHEREQWPTVGLGVQAQVDDASTGFAYGRLTVGLPRVDGDPSTRATLMATLHHAEARLVEARRAWQERLSQAHHEVEHQRHTVELVEGGLVPAAVARRQNAEKRLGLGAGEVFEVVAAARAEAEARRRASAARVGAAAAIAALALLDPGHLDPDHTGHDGDHVDHAGHHDDGIVAPQPPEATP